MWCVQGTAGQEVEAVSDLSALVNYIEPIRFHSFEHADSKSLYMCPFFSHICNCSFLNNVSFQLLLLLLLLKM